MEYEHIRLLHSGVQSTQSSLRQKYWIIHDKSYVRSVIQKCIICFRYRARGANQLLGQLPPSRAVSYTHLDVYKRQMYAFDVDFERCPPWRKSTGPA